MEIGVETTVNTETIILLSMALAIAGILIVLVAVSTRKLAK